MDNLKGPYRMPKSSMQVLKFVYLQFSGFALDGRMAGRMGRHNSAANGPQLTTDMQ